MFFYFAVIILLRLNSTESRILANAGVSELLMQPIMYYPKLKSLRTTILL